MSTKEFNNSSHAIADLMTVAEVADALRVRPRWVYDAVAKGVLPAGRFGKHMRFRRSDIRAYIDNCLE